MSAEGTIVRFSETDEGESDEQRRERARALTDEIKSRAAEVFDLLVTAYQSAAWLDLGYGTWDDYCREEFGDAITLPTGDERSRVISLFSEVGMSTREIASATGVSQPTVSRSLSDSSESDDDLEDDSADDEDESEQTDEDEIVDAELIDEPHTVDENGKPAFPLTDKTTAKIVPLVRRLAAALEATAADKRWTAERRKINAALKQPLAELRAALDVIGAK